MSTNKSAMLTYFQRGKYNEKCLSNTKWAIMVLKCFHAQQ